MVRLILDVARMKICLHIVQRHCLNFYCLSMGLLTIHADFTSRDIEDFKRTVCEIVRIGVDSILF